MTMLMHQTELAREAFVSAWINEDDDALVVQVDTRETGRLRVNVNDAAVFDKDPDGPRRILTEYDEELLAEFLDYLRGIRGYSVELDAGVSVPTPTLIAEFRDNLETVEAEDI